MPINEKTITETAVVNVIDVNGVEHQLQVTKEELERLANALAPHISKGRG